MALSTFWWWSTWWRCENVPRSTSWPDNRTWIPSLSSEPKAIASPIAQSTILLSTISLRAARIRIKPLWMMNSAAFGGGDENRLPICVRVSSLTPVGATFNGSLPSKKPDHGESNQSLYYGDQIFLNYCFEIIQTRMARARLWGVGSCLRCSTCQLEHALKNYVCLLWCESLF